MFLGGGESPLTGRHWPIFSNLQRLLRWFYGLRIVCWGSVKRPIIGGTLVEVLRQVPGRSVEDFVSLLRG